MALVNGTTIMRKHYSIMTDTAFLKPRNVSHLFFAETGFDEFFQLFQRLFRLGAVCPDSEC